MVGANEKYQKIKWTNDDNVRTADSILKAWEELGQDLRTERDISYDYNGRHSNDVLDYDKIK